jgi:hypothetical protein
MRSAFRCADRRPVRTVAGLALLVATSACVFGPAPRTYGPAVATGGIEAKVSARRDDGAPVKLRGELLAVTDSSLVLLAEGGLIQEVPFRLTHEATFHDAVSYGFSAKHPLPDRRRRELALYARFPYGLAPDVLDELLARARQGGLLTLGTPSPRTGVAMRLRVFIGAEAQTWLSGELLAVQDTALVLLRANRVVRLPYLCIAEVTMEGFATPPGVGRGATPDPQARKALARRARYPEGVDAERLRAIAGPGAPEPVTLRCTASH